MTWIHRSCPICEASCGLRIEVDREAQQVLSIRGDPEDPRSRGYLCPKAYALKGVYEDPDRIREPIRRTASGWESMSWDAALELVGSRLREIREQYGKDAVGVYIGNPIGHCFSGLLSVEMFLRALDTERLFSAATMDQQPKNLSSALLFGEVWAIPIPDIDRTDYLLLLGGNPLISQGSLMSAPNAKARLQALRERGGAFVVVDPRRTETADLADRHLFIKPGTDAFFLFALVNVLFAEGRVSLGRLAEFTDGVERVQELAEVFTPEAVAPVTGIAPEEIRRIAREFSDAERAACYGRIGTCTQEFGTLASWLVDLVNILTGNLDRPGGAMFPRPATGQAEPHAWDGSPLPYGRWQSRVRGVPEFFGQLPSAVMAEELEAGSAGEQRVRGFISVCGNPVLSTPNGVRLGHALEELDFMVSFDIYLNETTRHADLILPTTTQLEDSNYDFLFQSTGVRNFARWSPPVFDPPPGAKSLGWLMLEIAARATGVTAEALDTLLFEGMLATFVGKPGSPCERVDPAEARAKLGTQRGAERLLDLMLRAGPYGDGFDDGAEGLSLAKLKQVPHAIDLGPLEPRLPEILRTAGRRICLVHEIIERDMARLHQVFAERREDDRLRLIGRRQLRNMNSWLHNVQSLAKGKQRCKLLVHPDDAERIGLQQGGSAKVRSRVGSVVAQVALSDEMMPGVVSLPHGFGHTDPEARLSVANSVQPGANSNQLCDELLMDVPSGTSIANGIPVEVSPA